MRWCGVNVGRSVGWLILGWCSVNVKHESIEYRSGIEREREKERESESNLPTITLTL